MSNEPRQYDLAIVGAGINGAGIARDAALRGLSVIIFDQADMWAGRVGMFQFPDPISPHQPMPSDPPARKLRSS